MNRDDDIFADALELPASERAAFLDRACGDDVVLRTRIEALLLGHEAAQDFLERPATPRPPVQPDPAAGDLIDRYTLLRQIGEGGYGTVWLAEQRAPIHRFVALKVIKLGMDTREVIARFAEERQTLALMAHPDIAQVFDAGATATGRPYFVMEYVEGVPITRYCDDHDLPLAARLDLFARVCGAVQHAHQKGVIHRDLKPSNILVTLRDGAPAAKIIDFGIAKATQGRRAGQTLLTEAGHIVGTPAYMSPEQAGLHGNDIDTRSDVYALGVVLYELLTGRPPHDPKSLEQAGLLEIQRIIREVDPPRPSTVIGALPHLDRGTIARQRGAAALQLTAVLRGDLDWIVMRCLEKDREHRYSSASELAEDIRRHLREEPVLARPLQLRYRFRKFVGRNRGLCVSVAAIAVALVTGTIVSVRQAVRATKAERLASAERDVATAARADAQRRQEQAEGLLTFMLGDFRTELSKIGRLDLLDRVGAKAMEYFVALDPRDLTDLALTRQARALTQIGEVRLDQARYPEATEAFVTAHARAGALVDRHPQNADMLFERGQAEFWIGLAARRRGDFPTERTWYTRYRDTALALATIEGPTKRAQLETIYGHHNLAVLEADRGSLEQAAQGFHAEAEALERLLAAQPDDTQLLFNRADVTSWLGTVAERQGNYAEAARLYAELAERYTDLHRREPGVARWRLETALAATFRGRIAAITGQQKAATEFYAAARPVNDALVAQDPKNKSWLLFQQGLQVNQAVLLLAGSNPADAAPLLAETRQKLETMAAADPAWTTYRRILAAACRHESHLHLNQDDPRGAAPLLARARELGEALLKDSRADDSARYELVHACLLSAELADREGDATAASGLRRQAFEIFAARLAAATDWRVLEAGAMACVLSGRTDEAAPLIARLRSFGFVPVDPWIREKLGLALPPLSPSTSTSNPKQ